MTHRVDEPEKAPGSPPHARAGGQDGSNNRLAFAAEWGLKLVCYVFFILAFALAGAYFGSFVDPLLRHIGQEGVGHGRCAGWMLGALTAAIGLPMGWVKIGGKRFSFPRRAPRRRKKILPRVRKRKASEDGQGDEPTRVGEVFKTGGTLGLIGSVCGLFLGAYLVVIWFSLAMSPFAPGGWFESITFEQDSHRETTPLARQDEPAMSMSTKNPVAWYFFLSPVVILGAVGAISGMTLGTISYVRYRRDLADRRNERATRM